MEREGCCSKPCLGGFVCMDCCANEAFVHAGSVVQPDGKPGGAGKLPKDRVIGRAKVPILGGGEDDDEGKKYNKMMHRGQLDATTHSCVFFLLFFLRTRVTRKFEMLCGTKRRVTR